MTAALDQAKAVATRVLGHEGRVISFSKSGYRKSRPSNIAVFNSRVVVALSDGYAENVWSGDLDLTLWEERLAVLARLLERRVFLLHEADRRDSYPREPRELAVVCFSPVGKAEIPERRQSYLVRADDGTLRLDLPPLSRKRWRWTVLLHGPRLLRFWIVTRKRTSSPDSWRQTSLIYVGARDAGRTPLLVLGWSEIDNVRERSLALEWTWYSAHPTPRNAPNDLLNVRPRVWIGRTTFWAQPILFPGLTYSLLVGVTRKRLR